MHRLEKRTGITDTAHAAPAADRKAHLRQRLNETRTRKNLGSAVGTRRQNLLDPGKRHAAKLQSLFRHKTGSDHHGGIGCRGAARHGGDAKGTVR